MKKYFITSDIHSFYTEFITELLKQGFDKDNQDHILVILGDLFDRGKETVNLFNFILSIPKERRILIKGNHEELYKYLLKKGFPDSYDFSNGTVSTFCQISNIDKERLTVKYWYKLSAKGLLPYADEYEKIYDTWQTITKKVKDSDVTKFIEDDSQWINYLETEHYIFVHSWIPCATKPKEFSYAPEEIGYREDWRNATQTEWSDATWGCPWKKAQLGWNKTNKTIVCGHWHTSDFFNNLTKQKKKDVYDCPIFKSKKYKLIGLDACTAGSHKVNILVLSEDEL